MDSSSTFIFEVVFSEETPGSLGSGRSVIVEVEPDGLAKAATHLPSGKAALRCAKELAPEVAMQVIQKDFPHGFEPAYSVVQIDQLPHHLNHHAPKLQGNRFRAWMI
jgi:hypothetical protein